MVSPGLQKVGLAAAIIAYPILVTTSLVKPPLILLAPLLSGLMLAAASSSGPRSYCPVKLGAVPGVLGLAASLHLAGSGGQAGLLVEYLGLQEVTGLWVEALYHLTTVPALGGAFLLLAWRLGIAKGQQA